MSSRRTTVSDLWPGDLNRADLRGNLAPGRKPTVGTLTRPRQLQLRRCLQKCLQFDLDAWASSSRASVPQNFCQWA